MYRAVTVSLNSINILAQKQFGYGKDLSDVKILYNFIDEILSALTNKTQSSGLSAELVRPFWLWIMTVLSKLLCYGLKAMVVCALNSTITIDNKQQWFTLNSQCTSHFGTGKHAIPQGSTLLHMLFLIYIRLANHSQTDTHLLILQTTENRVSRTNEQQSGLQLCQLSTG